MGTSGEKTKLVDQDALQIFQSSPNDVGGNRIRREAKQIVESLVRQLADPENWPRLKSTQTMVRLSRYNRAKLAKYQSSAGFRSLNETVTFLLESSHQENMVLPGSTKLVFYGDSPVAVIGVSGSGKTTFVRRQVVPFAPGPVLVVDSVGEYSELKKITLPEIIGLTWTKAAKALRIRFTPNSNPHLSKTELDLLFSHLNVTKQEKFEPGRFPSGPLSTWSFIIEESHRLRHIEAAMNFVLEARKFTRKVITVTSDASLFASVCRLLKPPNPREVPPSGQEARL